MPPNLDPESEPEPSSLADWSLALGLMSFLCVFMTSVPALICGHLALARIKHSNGMLTGRGRAIAGLVLGYLGILIFLIILGLEHQIALPAAAMVLVVGGLAIWGWRVSMRKRRQDPGAADTALNTPPPIRSTVRSKNKGKGFLSGRANKGCLVILLLPFFWIPVSMSIAWVKTRRCLDHIHSGMSMREVYQNATGYDFSVIDCLGEAGKSTSMFVDQNAAGGFSIRQEKGAEVNFEHREEFFEFLERRKGYLSGATQVRLFFDNPLGFGGTTVVVDLDADQKVASVGMRTRSP